LIDIGVLHVSGDEIPNVRELLTAERSKGSWWADPAAQRIFAVTQELEDHVDVTVTKLISKKVTFVHRKLWTRLFAVASARDDWQLESLSKPAQFLLKEIDKDGTLFTNSMKKSLVAKTGDAARELELRLLVHSDQFHTESGAHAKRLETWESWARRVNLKGQPVGSERARRFLEKRLDEINKSYSGRGRLPWQS
jgi:hypothetical protein